MVFYCCLCNWGTQSTILTNHPKSFQHSGTYETCLSDFHKLKYTGDRHRCISGTDKMGRFTPAHKKGSRTDKENYRPISILPIYRKFMKDVHSNN